jgi:hypothetical protein
MVKNKYSSIMSLQRKIHPDNSTEELEALYLTKTLKTLPQSQESSQEYSSSL